MCDRLTVTISCGLAAKLATLRDEHGVSVSALVEHALSDYLERIPARAIGDELRAAGVSRRRPAS